MSEVNDNGDGGGDGGGSWPVRRRKEQGRKCECVFHVADSGGLEELKKGVCEITKIPCQIGVYRKVVWKKGVYESFSYLVYGQVRASCDDVMLASPQNILS